MSEPQRPIVLLEFKIEAAAEGLNLPINYYGSRLDDIIDPECRGEASVIASAVRRTLRALLTRRLNKQLQFLQGGRR